MVEHKVSNRKHEALTQEGIQIDVENIIKKGILLIRDDINKYLVKRNDETLGNYFKIISEVSKKSNKLIERMLKIKS